MRKLLPWLVLVALLIVSVTPAMALPSTDLNALARYFPDDTSIFFSMQFNQDTFDTVDSLIARVADALPADLDIDRRSLAEHMDQSLSDMGKTFSEDIQPWLGDTLAFGVVHLGLQNFNTSRRLNRALDDQTIIAALSITDAAAAEAFVTEGLADNGAEVERSDGDGFTIFASPRDDVTMVIRDDVILMSNAPELADGSLPASSLADNPALGEALALLPESDYLGTLFVNLPGIIARAGDQLDNLGQLSDLINGLGPVVGGFTLIDDVNLVLDVAVAADLSALDAVGYNTNLSPVDPDFARFIPANTALVGLGSNIATQYDNMLAQMKLQAGLMETMAQLGPDMGAFNAEDMDAAMAQFEEGQRLFEEYTGLNLRDDVVSWMTGSYAGFLTLNPEGDFSSTFGLLSRLPIELGVVIEATDPAAAATTVEGLVKGLDRFLVPLAAQDEDAKVEFSNETISGTDVTVVSITNKGLPWQLEILLGSNDEIFVLGTRSAVTRVLQGDGMLNTSDSFARAQSLSLANSVSSGFFDPAPLMPLTELMDSMSSNSDNDQMAQANPIVVALINLIDSVSTSQSVSDSSLHARMVLSLSE